MWQRFRHYLSLRIAFITETIWLLVLLLACGTCVVFTILMNSPIFIGIWFLILILHFLRIWVSIYASEHPYRHPVLYTLFVERYFDPDSILVTYERFPNGPFTDEETAYIKRRLAEKAAYAEKSSSGLAFLLLTRACGGHSQDVSLAESCSQEVQK